MKLTIILQIQKRKERMRRRGGGRGRGRGKVKLEEIKKLSGKYHFSYENENRKNNSYYVLFMI